MIKGIQNRNTNSFDKKYREQHDMLLVDDIHILDVRSKNGWIQSPIKCPMKSRFVAVLDQQRIAHLFTYWNKNKQYFCITLNELIPDLAISSMKQGATMKKPQQIQQHDDDEKGGDGAAEDAKLRVCFMVKIQCIQTLIQIPLRILSPSQ